MTGLELAGIWREGPMELSVTVSYAVLSGSEVRRGALMPVNIAFTDNTMGAVRATFAYRF